MPPQQCWNYFFYTSSGWPKFAYVANPVPPETRHMTYELHSQRCSCFRFSILPVLYTQDTFELWGRPFLSSLFVSFFRCCYERNSIHTALLSHFISLVHSLFVSLNDEPRLAHWMQQSAGSAFQFYYNFWISSWWWRMSCCCPKLMTSLACQKDWYYRWPKCRPVSTKCFVMGYQELKTYVDPFMGAMFLCMEKLQKWRHVYTLDLRRVSCWEIPVVLSDGHVQSIV